MIARVVVDIKHEDVNQVFDYLIPENLNQNVSKGSRVLVPFNTMTRVGYIIDILDYSELATKSIIEILDLYPVIDEESFSIANHLLKTPKSLLASVYQSIVPNELLMHYSKRITLLKPDKIKEELKPLFNQANHYYPTKSEFKNNHQFKALEDKGIVSIETVIKPKVKEKKITYVLLGNTNHKTTIRQQKIVDFVGSNDRVLMSVLKEDASPNIIQSLIKKGVLRVVEEAYEFIPQTYRDKPKILLNEDEEECFNQFLESVDKSKTIALFHEDIGVGRLPLKIFNHILKANQQIIYLVPEIDDVSKTINKLQDIFITTNIVAIHSDLTPKQKLTSYQQFINQEALVLVGTRSAVFTPSSQLGLIYVDDASNPSYIQDEQVNYDALDIVKLRSKYHKIPVILSSHTHRAETIYDIANKKTIEFKLNHNNQNSLDVIDMTEELKKGNASIFSETLKSLMNETIKSRKQAILVMNQKGYAPFMMCRRCGFVPRDPMTQIPLTFYEHDDVLKSNYRDYQEVFKNVCPACGKPAMKPVGFGVEFVESAIKKLYPNEKTLRVDASTLSNAKQRQTTLSNVSDARFIVGTELALKQVNSKTQLISILLADQFLQVPTYQAHEKAYRLFKELSLYKDIKTMLQTYNPNHKIIEYIKKNQSDEFYKDTLKNRKLLELPPFEKVSQVLLEGKSYLKTFQDAHYIKSLAIRYGMTVLGPISSYVFKLKDLYRVIITLKYQQIDQDVIDYLNSYSNPDIKLSYCPGIKWS